MAQQRDLKIDQGTDIAVELHLKQSNGSPKNLTSHSLRGKIKKNYTTSDSDQIFDWTTSISSVAGGIGLISLTNDVTDTMKPGRYVYDIELVKTGDADSETIERILEGTINVTPSVTK